MMNQILINGISRETGNDVQVIMQSAVDFVHLNRFKTWQMVHTLTGQFPYSKDRIKLIKKSVNDIKPTSFAVGRRIQLFREYLHFDLGYSICDVLHATRAELYFLHEIFLNVMRSQSGLSRSEIVTKVHSLYRLILKHAKQLHSELEILHGRNTSNLYSFDYSGKISRLR